MKHLFWVILTFIVMIIMYMRSNSGYNNRFMPFYNGKTFEDDHLAN